MNVISEELADALETLIEKYIDPSGKFILMITSEEIPCYWVKAQQALNHYKKLKERGLINEQR